MQPLSRIGPRLLFDSIASPSATRPLRLSSRASTNASRCLRCRITFQTRPFANSSKPLSPSRPSSTPSPAHADGTSKSANPNGASAPISEGSPANLPSTLENRRLDVTKRFSDLMDHLQGNIFIASQRINDLTGYSGIEALKQRISAYEKRVTDTQNLVRSTRLKYKTTIAERAATQREVTTLLSRKDSWTPSDLERFTALYRMDHSNEHAVQEAATNLADAEREAEAAASKLNSNILARYHEEQIWSDKIRRMSTWGTWGLMGVNALMFLIFQFGLEPWRRKRLTKGFEEKVKQALAEEKAVEELRRHKVEDTDVKELPLGGVIAAGIEELQDEVNDGSKNGEPAVDAVVGLIKGEEGGEKILQEELPPLDIPETKIPWTLQQFRWSLRTWVVGTQGFFTDLVSERRIDMRKKDVTILALESFASGSAIVAIIATILLRPS